MNLALSPVLSHSGVAAISLSPPLFQSHTLHMGLLFFAKAV